MPETQNVTVTAAVATYNEEAYIERCLSSIAAQRETPGTIEIVVVDGMSTDSTQRLAQAFAADGHELRLIENRDRLQAFAWNLALSTARGEYFAMMGAHAEYGPDYIARCIEVMRRTGAAAVGGVQVPCGAGLMGRAIAWCMSSPFGVGNARFRYAVTEEEADSVFSMFARTATLRALGGFDERISFDEDADLCYRLKKAGGKIVVSPRIPVRYWVRRSLGALGRQMFRYGYWRRVTQAKHKGLVPLRTYAPGALVALLGISIALMAIGPLEASIVPGLYALFLLTAAAAAAARVGVSAFLVPPALATMHISYGVGSWMGLVGAPRRLRVEP